MQKGETVMDLAGDSPSATKTGRSVPILNFPATKHRIGFNVRNVDLARFWSRKLDDGPEEEVEEEDDEDDEVGEDEEVAEDVAELLEGEGIEESVLATESSWARSSWHLPSVAASISFVLPAST